MKIFFPLDAFYPSQLGGPCNTLYWHTCELQKHNIKTSIVTSTLGLNKGEVHENTSLEKDCGTVYYGAGASLNLKKIRILFFNIRNCDIIHLNSLFSPLAIVCFSLCKLFYRRKKIVWSPRGELSKEALKFSSWKKKPVLFLYKRLTNKVLFHSTSNQETQDIRAMFNKREIFEMPNLLRPAPRLLLNPIKKQLLFVGRIHPIKALHKVIIGLSLSKSFMASNFKFVVAGDYEDRHLWYYNELLALINEKHMAHKIEFKGHIKGEEKEITFAESYFTLLLSDSENFGNVIIESLNQGTPILASSGTPWSILGESRSGFHISNDPQEISVYIDKVINLSDLDYLLFRQNAVTLVDAQFNISNQIHKWVEKYNQKNNGN